MAGIDEVLERLRTDAAFWDELARDPREALAGYELTSADLRVLAKHVSPPSQRGRRLAEFFDGASREDGDETSEIE